AEHGVGITDAVRAFVYRYSILAAHEGSRARIKPIASWQASPFKSFRASRFKAFLRSQISASDSPHEAATQLGVHESEPTWMSASSTSGSSYAARSIAASSRSASEALTSSRTSMSPWGCFIMLSPHFMSMGYGCRQVSPSVQSEG